MTQTSIVKKGEQLHNLVQELKSKMLNINLYAMDIAASLYRATALYRYSDIASPPKSFKQWLAQSGVPISYDKARQWIRIYKVFVKQVGITPKALSEVDWTKLRLLLPVARQTGTSVPELLEKAKELSISDLALEIRQQGIDVGQCTHQDVEEITTYRCRICGEHLRKSPVAYLGKDMPAEMDKLISEFLKKTGLKEAGESRKRTRMYAKLLLLKYEKEKIIECIEWLMADKWWQDNLSKLSQVYHKMPMYLREGETKVEEF